MTVIRTTWTLAKSTIKFPKTFADIRIFLDLGHIPGQLTFSYLQLNSEVFKHSLTHHNISIFLKFKNNCLG